MMNLIPLVITSSFAKVTLICQFPVATYNKMTATSNESHPKANDFPDTLAAS